MVGLGGNMDSRIDVDIYDQMLGDPEISDSLGMIYDEQQCSYCGQWFPNPVDLHHSQEECDDISENLDMFGEPV